MGGSRLLVLRCPQTRCAEGPPSSHCVNDRNLPWAQPRTLGTVITTALLPPVCVLKPGWPGLPTCPMPLAALSLTLYTTPANDSRAGISGPFLN